MERKGLRAFLKGETVLCAAAVLAVVSAFCGFLEKMLAGLYHIVQGKI